MPRAIRHFAWVAALVLAAPPALAQGTGRIEGAVSLAVDGVPLGSVGPIVVYVQPETEQGQAAPPARKPEIRQYNARFSPAFLAVTQGVRIQMPNDDDIDHNVYSASGRNRFDLGIYEAGQVRAVELKHPGQVDIHCSIHESMNATIFVSPSPWFGQVGVGGVFTIEGLPAGRYRLRTWSQRLPRAEMYFRIRPGETFRPNVVIGAP